MKKDYFFPLICIFLIVASALLIGCDSDELAMPDLSFCDSLAFNELTYDADILPILNEKCNTENCHPSNSPLGDFTNYQSILPFLESEKINNQIFVEERMPPQNNPDLTQEEKDKLQCWLGNGYPEN